MLTGNEKINQKEMISLLDQLDINHIENNTFKCIASEKEIKVILQGNKLANLLHFISNHYYNMGEHYGKQSGIRETQAQVKKVLGIK